MMVMPNPRTVTQARIRGAIGTNLSLHLLGYNRGSPHPKHHGLKSFTGFPTSAKLRRLLGRKAFNLLVQFGVIKSMKSLGFRDRGYFYPDIEVYIKIE